MRRKTRIIALALSLAGAAAVVGATPAWAKPPVGKVSFGERLRNVGRRGLIGNVRFIKGRIEAAFNAPRRVLRRKAIGRVIALPESVRRVDHRGQPTFYVADTQHAAAKLLGLIEDRRIVRYTGPADKAGPGFKQTVRELIWDNGRALNVSGQQGHYVLGTGGTKAEQWSADGARSLGVRTQADLTWRAVDVAARLSNGKTVRISQDAMGWDEHGRAVAELLSSKPGFTLHLPGRVKPSFEVTIKRPGLRYNGCDVLSMTVKQAKKGEPLAVNTAGLTISGADYAGSIDTMAKLLQRERSAHVVVGGGSYAGVEVQHVNELLRQPGSKGLQLIADPNDPHNRTEHAHRLDADGSVKQYNAAVRVQKRGGVVHTLQEISRALVSGAGYKGLSSRRAVTEP